VLWEPAQIEDLLQRAQNGSQEALGQLLQAFRPYLLSLANQELDAALQGKGGGSDLVQDTFLEAQRDIGKFLGSTEGEFLAWLRKMLLNNLANFRRQFREVAKREITREQPLEHGSNGNLAKGLPADTPSPSELVSSREQLQQVEAALEQLPSPFREVIVWRNLELLPFSTIAQRLNRTEKAAQKLWARAIQQLQKRIASST
jgi:RNA polymerase sigma-70 factor (ECF subfamily)